MRGKLKPVLLGALCGAFTFAAAALGFPMNAGAPQANNGLRQPLQQIRAVHPATGRHCLGWKRTWNPRQGIGRRHCVHWT